MTKVLIVIVLAIVILAILAAVAWAQTPQLHPKLEQPLTFPHITHVRVANIDCTFCHRGIGQVSTRSAGYPPLEQCMFCHKVVATDRPAIQQLRTAFDSGQPINWVRVFRLPDHVKFLHDPHIRAGFDCTQCHGNVADQQQVVQSRVLRMGDCVDCHRVNNARTDCSVCHY